MNQVKGDPRRAEEYYSRAMLADPTDGEIMSQYAKLVWAVYRDHERSLAYFQKSVQAAPRNRYARCRPPNKSTVNLSSLKLAGS
jgi:Tfp pilus assembly protein PilF